MKAETEQIAAVSHLKQRNAESENEYGRLCEKGKSAESQYQKAQERRNEAVILFERRTDFASKKITEIGFLKQSIKGKSGEIEDKASEVAKVLRGQEELIKEVRQEIEKSAECCNRPLVALPQLCQDERTRQAISAAPRGKKLEAATEERKQAAASVDADSKARAANLQDLISANDEAQAKNEKHAASVQQVEAKYEAMKQSEVAAENEADKKRTAETDKQEKAAAKRALVEEAIAKAELDAVAGRETLSRADTEREAAKAEHDAEAQNLCDEIATAENRREEALRGERETTALAEAARAKTEEKKASNNYIIMLRGYPDRRT